MFRRSLKTIRILQVRSKHCKVNFLVSDHQVCLTKFLFVVDRLTNHSIILQPFSTVYFDTSSHNGIKLLNTLSGVRCISVNRSVILNDNKKGTTSQPIDTTKPKINIDDLHPVEDLVNAPLELKEKSLEINTNKGKLVVTTSTTGTELKNVVFEVKSDKKPTETAKPDDVDDAAKKARVRCIS